MRFPRGGNEVLKKPKGNSLDSAGAAAKVALVAIMLMASAALMGVALQSSSGRVLGWFTLVPLFYLIRLLTPLRAWFAGAFWGLCLFFFGATAADAPFAPTLLNLLLLSTIPGIYAWAGALLTRSIGFSPLLLGLGWIGVELALQPLALYNGLLAGTQGHGLVVRTMGYLAGSVVVAFIVAYVNASLLEMVTHACVATGEARIASGFAGPEERFFPLELPAYLFQFLRPGQPRAPPL